MILLKSKIYETNLFSLLNYIPVNLKNFGIEPIPNCKRKRIYSFLHSFGASTSYPCSRDYIHNYVASTQRPDLLKFYGDYTMGSISSLIEGRRCDLLDEYFLTRQCGTIEITIGMKQSIKNRFFQVFNFFFSLRQNHRDRKWNIGTCIDEVLRNKDKQCLKFLKKLESALYIF